MDKNLNEMTPQEIWRSIMEAYDSEIYSASKKMSSEDHNIFCKDIIIDEWTKHGKAFPLEDVLKYNDECKNEYAIASRLRMSGTYGTVTPEQIAKYQRSKELYSYINTVLKKVKRVINNSTDPAMIELTDEMRTDLIIKEVSKCITDHWLESNKDFDLDQTLYTIEVLVKFMGA